MRRALTGPDPAIPLSSPEGNRRTAIGSVPSGGSPKFSGGDQRTATTPPALRWGARLCQADATMDVYLVDGTYELFRHHFAVPSQRDLDGMEIAATPGRPGSILA